MSNIQFFYKYQGTGNDFVLIDNWDSTIQLEPSILAKKVCSRKWGIGADGLLLLQKHERYDFEVIFYNPDGSLDMCGNGSRCAVYHALHMPQLKGKEKVIFLAKDGVHNGYLVEKDIINITMKNIEASVEKLNGGYFLNTGTPHFVKILEDFSEINLAKEADDINKQPPFIQENTSVNFAIFNKATNTIKLRTFERGVEEETLSCGTGSTAATLLALTQGFKSPVSVLALGGTLLVDCGDYGINYFRDITLSGSVGMVFKGEITL